MNDFVRRYSLVIVGAFILALALFLFRLAYLPIWTSTTIGLILLMALRHFLDIRYQIKAPLYLVGLLLLAIELDAIGNLLKLYEQRFRYMQYDEITHALVPALVMPVVIWVMQSALVRFGYHLPPGVVVLFALTLVFTLAGIYEVLELWDDKYMHPTPGWRIHGAYDTSNDLQWDLIGMGTGALVTYLIHRSHVKQRAASG